MTPGEQYEQAKIDAYAMVTAYLHDDLATLAVLVDTVTDPQFTTSVLVALVGIMHTLRVETEGGDQAAILASWAAFLLDEASNV